LALNFKPKKVVQVFEKEALVNEHLSLVARLCPTAKIGYTQ
jgi:hypothetical protein